MENNPNSPLPDLLHDGGRDAVLVVGLEGLQELQVAQQLLGRPPEVLHHLAAAQGVRLALRLDGAHHTDGLHHQLDTGRRILHGKQEIGIKKKKNLSLGLFTKERIMF